MLKRILAFIKKVELDIAQSEKEFKEMSERNKKFSEETRHRIKIKREEFDKKRASRDFF